MKFLSTTLVVVVAAAAVNNRALADCTSFGGEAVAALIEPAIVKIQTIGTGDCTGNGTGFLIAASGLVITAKHVVPQECDGEIIAGQIQNDTKTYQLKVIQRSGLDVALLQFVNPGRNFPALYVMRPITNELGYRGKDVVIASFYPEYPEPVVTTARIDSTVIIGESNEWGLCAVAANPGRSGSPVVMPDGTVVAVFVARPGGEQDIARVIPLADVADINVLTETSSDIHFVASQNEAVAIKSNPVPLLYDFDLDASVSAHRSLTETAGRYIFKNSEFSPADKLSYLELLQQSRLGAVVRYEEVQTRTFDAPPGYEFDPSVFGLRVASHNPVQAPLPLKACGQGGSIDCYEFSPDHKHLTLHFRLFAGSVPFDQAHSWLEGAIATRLVPAGPHQ